MKVLKSYSFGFDLVEITRVMVYVENTYDSSTDYNMYIGLGDDCMNCLEVCSEEMLKDSKLGELIVECVGEGEFDEDED
jgi:hypothetical protein